MICGMMCLITMACRTASFIYRADVEGELFLVDESSERLLATVSLQPGEEHEIIYDIKDEKLAANLDALGIDPEKAEFKLFFVPRR